jgi:uncharacterized membrane protein
VKQSDGSFIGNGQKLQLNPAQVTNDLRIVRQVVAADENVQNLLRQRQQQAAAAAAAAAAQRATPKPAATPVGKARPAVSAQTPRPPLGSSLGAAHTMTKDGYVWTRDEKGGWVPLRPVR